MTYAHILLFTLLGGAWVVILILWIRDKNPSNLVSFEKKYFIINNAVLYALSFNLIFFIQELFLVLGKKSLGLTSYLYHNNHNWDGSDPRTDLMQGSGALAIFITAIFCLILLLFNRKSSKWIKVLLLWLTFHGFMQSLPQIIIGVVSPSTDVGLALDYMGLSLNVKLIISTISAGTVILIARFLSHYIVELAPQMELVNNSRRRIKFLILIALLPALLGAILSIPFRLPPVSQIIAPFIVTIMALPWMITGSSTNKSITLVENEIGKKVIWAAVIALILLLLFFQLVLAPGLKF